MNKNTVAKASVTINAPIQKVWGVLTDFDQWPQWQKDVSAAEFDGALAPGSIFHWKGGGMNIASTLTSVEAPNAITWEGKAVGMRAVHSWRLKQTDAGVTVSSEDTLSGWFVLLISIFKPTFFQSALETTLAELKKVVEN